MNPNRTQWIVVSFATVVGLLSIFYTNTLVEDLSRREKKQIEMFAKGQEFIATAEADDDLNFLVDEIINANQTIPVILADDKGKPIDSKNIDIPDNVNKTDFLERRMLQMRKKYDPIYVILPEIKYMICYEDSFLVTQLKYFPFLQATVIGIFFVLIYFIFSSTRRAEQNSIWVGLAKETAHQLGTPLSSLMAWVEYFQADESVDQDIILELDKDVKRLGTITERFSNIGSKPALKTENVYLVTLNIISYLRKRVSSRVIFNIDAQTSDSFEAPLSKALFEWVIENICKNAVDAMAGIGKIDVQISTHIQNIIIDIQDTGKGVPHSKFKSIFEAGFTTKKRGWGLGLTLVKRIVEDYHQGQVFVLRSELNVGTTFRIIIPKKTLLKT
ncbi:MAG: sensor histidine kinase [Bacteroidetes bacterium]|nr:MAG: sensor histidine kinase [Bacteroidota bacterium]